MTIINAPKSVIAFAGEDNLELYKGFADFWNHYQTEMNGKTGLYFQRTRNVNGKEVEFSLPEKEAIINAALKKEIIRKSGITNINDFPLTTWAGHPVLNYVAFAVVSNLIDMILPDTLIKSVGIYSDIKTVGYGDTAAFNITPRDLFAVSKAGRAKRQTELKKQYRGQVVLNPEPRQIAVSVSLYRVLTGEESLASFTMKAVRSIETEMAYDIYGTFATAMNNISNTASTGLRTAGWSQAEFVRLSQTVRAWNQAEPIAIGTQAALASVLPADANYRYDFESDYVKVGHLKEFQMTKVIMLEQIADYATPFGLKLADNRIWIVSPSVDKLVKVAVEGSTLSSVDNPYANANLTQNANFSKSWQAAVATGAIGATIEL